MSPISRTNPATGGWVSRSHRTSFSLTSGNATFSIGNHAYVGMGYDHRFYISYASTQTAHRYSANTDSWEPFTAFGGNVRSQVVGFAINGVGYFLGLEGCPVCLKPFPISEGTNSDGDIHMQTI